MLQVTYSPEDLRLLEAADIAEKRHGDGKYDQGQWGDQYCDSPACMLGGYALEHRDTAVFDCVFRCADVVHEGLLKHFGITSEEYADLFGHTGCGNAGSDGRRAAAYVRRFVQERALARLKV